MPSVMNCLLDDGRFLYRELNVSAVNEHSTLVLHFNHSIVKTECHN